MSQKAWIIAIVILLLGLLAFFYINPIGIQIGYQMAGGSEIAVMQTDNPDTILHDYYRELDTYGRYCDSDNPTAQKWAEAAKEKAESLAEQYEQLTGMKP